MCSPRFFEWLKSALANIVSGNLLLDLTSGNLLLDLCEVTPASTCVKNILSYLFLFVHPYVVLIASIECTHPSPKKI